MLALGALLFGLSEARGGSLFAPRARLEIPAHRLEAVRRDFVADTARQPSAEEWRQLVRLQVDDELLFRYALTLGLHQNSAAQARLAQIAEFVDANPHETRPDDAADAGRARAALELGLHEGDLVVRRILIDSARRLIRSVVLLHRPTPEALRAHYTASAREYTRPPRLRLSQVAVNAFKWPDSRRRAQELHDRVGAGGLSFEQALALADATPAPVHLQLQTAQGLAAQFGNDFAEAVLALPPGAWSQPIPSRFGHHLVWVHERHEAEVPSLEAVQAQVEQRLLEHLADDWLRQRLDELRDEYEIVVPDQRP
jgi:parvulin-like peptidyl-prolyl isomerase